MQTESKVAAPLLSLCKVSCKRLKETLWSKQKCCTCSGLQFVQSCIAHTLTDISIVFDIKPTVVVAEIVESFFWQVEGPAVSC